MIQFRRGERVSFGEKTGIVVEIVPAGVTPRSVRVSNRRVQYRESYVVSVMTACADPVRKPGRVLHPTLTCQRFWPDPATLAAAAHRGILASGLV